MAMHSIAGMAASISANLKRIAKEKGQPLRTIPLRVDT